jgi:hypothetical protein
MQTQVLYLLAGRLNSLSSMKFESDVESRTQTVIDFVAVKASRFNRFQRHQREFCQHCFRRVHAGACQAYQELQLD